MTNNNAAPTWMTVRALVRDLAMAAAAWKGAGRTPDRIAVDVMTHADLLGAAHGVAAIVHAVNPPGHRGWGRLQDAIAQAIWGSVLEC